MKRLIFTFLGLSFLLLPFSCSNELDINRNPLAATTANPNALLPTLLVDYSNRRTTEIGSRCADVYQHVSATFNSPRLGSVASTLSGNMWSTWYQSILGNLSLIEKDSRTAGSTSNNVTAIVVTLKALAFFDLTCMFEDIPFTEALKPQEFPTPKFDSQQLVLNGLVQMLDEAIALIDNMPATGNFNVSSGDLIYGGNMDSWRRYARSLQLRVLMLIRNKDTSVDSKIVSIIGENRFITSSPALFRYAGPLGNRNGWNAILTSFFTPSNEESEVWGPSPVIRDILFNANDPRLDLWCTPGANGQYESSPIGTFPDASVALYRDRLISPNLPDIWFLPSEVSFYKAELTVKGVLPGGLSAADVFYKQGLTEIFNFWNATIPGVTSYSNRIATYVSGRSIAAMTNSNALIEIGNQQYLESFWRPIEGWNTVRRNNVPIIDAAPGATISTMLKRFPYPPNEIAPNPNVPGNKNTDVKMWFEN